MSKKLGIVKHKDFLKHESNENKLETPDRLKDIYNYIDTNPENFSFYSPEKISEEELQKVHSNFYIQQIKTYSDKNIIYNYDKDTYINKHTYDVACLAAGGCNVLSNKIMSGEIDKGFALVRPPGHHAEAGRAMGYCIFNNVAICAKHLLDNYDLNRIMIIDFDAHHGNGTQEIFYDNKKVFVLSIHQNNLFPFSGKGSEIGVDEGLNYNINIPVHPFFGDQEYAYIFGKAVQHIAEVYLPQIILVSAGFDGHEDDTSSKIQLSTKGYVMIAKYLKHFAKKYSDGKLMYILEGGYNKESLYKSITAVLNELKKEETNLPGFMHSERAYKIFKNEIPTEFIKEWRFDFV